MKKLWIIGILVVALVLIMPVVQSQAIATNEQPVVAATNVSTSFVPQSQVPEAQSVDGTFAAPMVQQFAQNSMATHAASMTTAVPIHRNDVIKTINAAALNTDNSNDMASFAWNERGNAPINTGADITPKTTLARVPTALRA